LAKLGSTINAATAAASAPTTGVLAAGADEVSAAVTALFDAHAKDYQALGARAAAFHEQLVQALNNGAASYAQAETASASPVGLLTTNGPSGAGGHGGNARLFGDGGAGGRAAPAVCSPVRLAATACTAKPGR
jgi:hypothetical protein